MTDLLRTPDEQFLGLSDFLYDPIYINDLKKFEGLRMHYVDIGPQDAGQVFLCLHAEPGIGCVVNGPDRYSWLLG